MEEGAGALPAVARPVPRRRTDGRRARGRQAGHAHHRTGPRRGPVGGSTDTQPEYCSSPAKYGGAPSYRKGTNRALFYGNDEYTDKLPGAWRAKDAAHAALIICAGEDEDGTSVQTCPYDSKIGTNFPTDVTFHKIAIPVKVYALRTGKLVADRTVQISGGSCPQTLEYTTYGPTDLGPPSDVYVSASKSDVQAGFRSLIKR
ncbi:hypothetical protein NKH77_17440 [Streptomyces sp. M19]